MGSGYVVFLVTRYTNVLAIMVFCHFPICQATPNHLREMDKKWKADLLVRPIVKE